MENNDQTIKRNPILMIDNDSIKPMYVKPEPKVNKMSVAEFVKYAADNHIKFTLPKDNREYPGQQCQEPELNFAFRSLHQNIINQIINFCQNWHIYIDEIHLNADCLEGSIKAGSWQACTDSCLRFDKFTQEYKDCVSMKDEASIEKIKDDKEWTRIKLEQVPYLISI